MYVICISPGLAPDHMPREQEEEESCSHETRMSPDRPPAPAAAAAAASLGDHSHCRLSILTSSVRLKFD